MKNDPRAAHTVNPLPGGFNVRIPYRGFIISLAADGLDTLILTGDSFESVLYEFEDAQISGTGGDSIRAAMDIIDLSKG